MTDEQSVAIEVELLTEMGEFATRHGYVTQSEVVGREE